MPASDDLSPRADHEALYGEVPLPGTLVGGQPVRHAALTIDQWIKGARPVIASVIYSDVPDNELEGDPPDARFEVLLLRLMPEPPFFEVGTWDMLTVPATPIGDQERFDNIVFAVREYEQMGGDV